MAEKKVVFVAFAKEDEGSKRMLVGQRLNTSTPFEWTDMSVDNPYVSGWKDRVRTRIRRSDGVIALISASTPQASGQLWEITCAREEGVPVLGLWLGSYRTKPAAMGTAPCVAWTWESVAEFINSL